MAAPSSDSDPDFKPEKQPGKQVDKPEKYAAPPIVINKLKLELQAPLTSLAILAPLCLLGEILRVSAGTTPATQQLLTDPLLVELGKLIHLNLPFVPMAALLIWWLLAQIGGKHPWRLPPVEALGLTLAWGAVWSICRLAVAFASHHAWPDSIAGTAGLLISGAIQEELLFRGIILGGGLFLMRCFTWPPIVLYALILPLSAAFFSLAHTSVINHHAGAELFAWQPFVERGLAGAIYGYAFIRQGLAVSTLAHLGYLVALEMGAARWL